MSDAVAAGADAPPRPVRAFLWRNIALIAAATPFVLAGVRVLLYSGGDPVVLRTLIETLNVPTVLLGTFVPLLPAFVLIGIQTVVFNGHLFNGFLRTRWGVIAAGIVVLFYAFIAPFPSGLTTIGAIFGGLLLGEITRRIILRHLRKRPRPAPAPETSAPETNGFTTILGGGNSFIAYGAVIGLMLTLPFGMWVPLERVEMANGSSQVTYVLNETANWTTTIAANKSIRVLPTKDIVGRSVCNQGDFKSLLTMIGHSDPSPKDKCKT